MKRVISIILCLTMLFVMAAVPALAENSGGKWVEILNEDFTNRSVNEPFAVDKSAAITYPDASAYIYYTGSNSQNVTYTVGEYESEKALKISRQGSKGDRRLFFEFNNYLSGQIEISFRMLASAIISEVVNVEVYDSPDVDTQKVITGTKIGVVSTGTRFYTHYYDGTAIGSSKTNDVKDEDLWLTANTWVDVKYSINTANGDVTAKYTYNGYTVTREIAVTDALPAVAGICFRLKNTTDTLDFYVDDIVVKHYEEPSFEEPEFDFSKISNESINAVTNQLNLINQFTDDEERLWYITWISDNNEVINSETGEVIPGTMDERVKLTAIFTNSGSGGGGNELSFKRSFNVKVLAAGTYHLKEGFDTAGNYSGHNAIAQYETKDAAWGVGSNYSYEEQDHVNDDGMSASISNDPENPQDKVLKLHRTATGTTQRVWTRISSDASKFNDKVYVGMRVLREKNGAPTDIYANSTDGTRLMRVLFNVNDTITYYYGDNINTNAASAVKAPSGKWFDFTIELDMKNGCFNACIDGQSIVQGNPATAVKGSGFGGLTFDVNRNYSDETTVYFDDITVRTTDGLPYSVAEYNFTDVNGYPTRSMVEGGFLKSISMRKMSSVEAGTEPSLYVCFFKGELLCNVVSVPLAQNAPLGGFDVELNEALPENPLDYSIKAFVFSEALVPLMESSTYVPYEDKPTIFVAGDSIAKTYSETEYPMTGYAQVLSENFDENINIENHAEGSRSSRSFIEEGRLAKILDKICSGDYLFIQFAHNDKKTDDRYTDPEGDENTQGSFKYYLMQYIDGARERGAVPVLLTSPASNEFVDGKLYDSTIIKYIEAIRELAQEKDVLLVDLYDGWAEFVDNRPEENGSKIDSRNYYMYIYSEDSRFIYDEAYKASKYYSADSSDKSVYSYYFDDDPTNVVHADGTHFNAYSARIAAKIIADSLKALDIGLSDNITAPGEIVWPWNGFETFGTQTHKIQ